MPNNLLGTSKGKYEGTRVNFVKYVECDRNALASLR
jgi:hypothetical protein